LKGLCNPVTPRAMLAGAHIPAVPPVWDMSKDRDLTEVVACRQARQPALEKGTPPNFLCRSSAEEAGSLG